MIRIGWKIYKSSPQFIRRYWARIVAFFAPAMGLVVSSIQARTFRMYIDFKDQAAFRYMMHKGDYERELVEMLLQVISLNPRSIFVDVGASYGFYSLSAASIGQYGLLRAVLAYEPDIRCSQSFLRSTDYNRLSDIIHFKRALVGDFAGQAEMFTSLQSSTSNRSFATDTTGHFRHTGAESLPSVTIDGELESMGYPVQESIVVVKIDVEGNEYRVISGMKSMLASARGAFVLLEFYPLGIREIGSNADALIKGLSVARWDAMSLRQAGKWEHFAQPEHFFQVLRDLYDRQNHNPAFVADLVLNRGIVLGPAQSA